MLDFKTSNVTTSKVSMCFHDINLLLNTSGNDSLFLGFFSAALFCHLHLC